jgi:Glycosyl transferases group 1
MSKVGSPSGAGASAPSVLILSMRRIARLVAYSIEYEFEDVVSAVTGAERIDVGPMEPLELSRRTYKLIRTLSGSRRVARGAAPRPSQTLLAKNYDLFFPVFNNAHELYALQTIPNWRERCRLAACFISEVALEQVPHYMLEMLADFDHIFICDPHLVDRVSRTVGRPCSHLPLGVDVLRFAPYPGTPERSIDVCSIGRRSQVTHAALLEYASQNPQFFYHYDTVEASGIDLKQRTFRVQDPRDHRLLLASLLKRSRYCFAYRGFVNDPELVSRREEMSARFYEGAAAGAIMLGEPPNTPDFNEQFDWEDVVIKLPYDSQDVGIVIAELNRDSERVTRIRNMNVHYAALRHDWVYRLKAVFKTLDLSLPDGVRDREAALQAVAAQVRREA